jgi:hypothetical protein
MLVYGAITPERYARLPLWKKVLAFLIVVAIGLIGGAPIFAPIRSWFFGGYAVLMAAFILWLSYRGRIAQAHYEQVQRGRAYLAPVSNPSHNITAADAAVQIRLKSK